MISTEMIKQGTNQSAAPTDTKVHGKLEHPEGGDSRWEEAGADEEAGGRDEDTDALNFTGTLRDVQNCWGIII